MLIGHDASKVAVSKRDFGGEIVGVDMSSNDTGTTYNCCVLRTDVWKKSEEVKK